MVTTTASARVKLIQLDELPDLADYVVEGTVIEKTARWDAKGIMINTHYTIEVQTSILGKAPATMELSFAGGTVNGQTIEVSHTPVLDVGQTYILFSYENNRYSVPTVGHDQGVFKVINDTRTKQDLIVDYNGYQIERITGRERLIRGRLTHIDSDGALVQRNVSQQGSSPPLKPVVRDADGKVIEQDESAYAQPKLREPSEPVTRSEFIQFIQMQAQRDKGAKK
jgi:hypothetical protein